ncbi:MAG: transglutaminase domain-containing protein [Coraliomargarita sp.]
MDRAMECAQVLRPVEHPPAAVSGAASLRASASVATTASSDGNEADAITAEIRELARGLLHDPVRIYQYCKNHIRYEHYFGSKKGATLTLLESSGNSFDTAALMVSLLRASGHTAGYKYAPLLLRDDQMADWLGLWQNGDTGVPFPYLTDEAFRTLVRAESSPRSTLNLRILYHYGLHSLTRGFPAVQPRDYLNQLWNLPHVFVTFEVDGTTYEADPSFKVLEDPATPVDLVAATGFDKSDFLAKISEGANEGSGYAQSLNQTKLNEELTKYTTKLTNWLRANRPNGATETLLGRRTEQDFSYGGLSDLPTPQYSSDVPWLAPVEWTEIPAQWMPTLTITAGEFDDTTQAFTTTRFTHSLNFPSLRGRKLSLAFDGNQGSFHLDDALLTDGARFAVPGTEVDIRLSVKHQHGNYDLDTGAFTTHRLHDQEEVKVYRKGDAFAYSFLYGFKPSGRLLRKRQEILDDYIRDPDHAVDSSEVVSETLYVMGLNWMLQTELNNQYVADLHAVTDFKFHRMGRMAQEEGYYIDASLAFSAMQSYSSDESAVLKAFQLHTLLDSALEHSLIEQMQGTDKSATSTIRILQLANKQDLRVYRATPSNWSSTVRPRLRAKGYSNTELDTIGAYITGQSAHVLLPEKPAVTLNQWSGTGYAIASSRTSAMIISGGYHGGYLSIPGTVDTISLQEYARTESSYYNTGSGGLTFTSQPVTTPSFFGAEEQECR